MRIFYHLALAIFFFLPACTISLLPDYDEELLNGINKANLQAQTLFSALETGASTGNFTKSEDQYHKTIGQFAALLTRARTRPEPSTSQSLAKRLEQLPRIAEACAEIRQEAEDTGKTCSGIVTPYALKEIVETLSRMRDAHKKFGIGPVTLAALVGDYEISIEQALTVEAALK